MTSIEASGSPQPTHSVSPHPTHSIPHRLRHRVGRASMYEPEGYGIYLQIVHLSRYEVIILEHHLVTRSESRRLDATDLLPCEVVSLVIGIGQATG